MEGIVMERSGQHPWRAVTRRVGYHSNEPYSKTLERLIANTTDDTKRAQLQKQLRRTQAVEKVLNEKGAFSRTEQGGVTRNFGIKFAVSKAVNDESGDFVIFMTDTAGMNILGDLPSSDSDIEPNTNQIEGLADLYEEARRQWDSLSEEEKNASEFITLEGLQTKVDFTYIGKVMYQDERQSVNELFGNEKFTLAIRVGESGFQTLHHSLIQVRRVLQERQKEVLSGNRLQEPKVNLMYLYLPARRSIILTVRDTLLYLSLLHHLESWDRIPCSTRL
jgi:hypothetical protein